MKQCPICDNPLGRNKYACSMECYSKLKSNTKECVICDSPFPSPPSSDRITCSRSCSTENRRRLAAEGKSDKGLEKAHKALPDNPLTGRFETHVNAKEWVIQAPDGKIYKCRNLKNWLREHSDLLDGTVNQAWDGLSKIKYSMQGKRKRNAIQWKGWRLISWGD